MREPPRHFVPAIRLPASLPGESLVYAFKRRSLLVRRSGDGTATPVTLAELEITDEVLLRRQYLGRLGERPALSYEIDDAWEPPEGMEFKSLRALFPLLGEDHLAIAGLAVQIVEWDRDHQFCGRCGAAMEQNPEERSKRCGRCALVSYPRVAPAVIVLVERGDELLLARSPHFPPGMYSTLAGFVEPGESLERTIHRELAEEVGVEVENLRYFGSQPWPFPHSLMVGFRVDWRGGDIATDDEIEDAAWFHADDLPRIPPRVSIARSLIEDYLAERRGRGG